MRTIIAAMFVGLLHVTSLTAEPSPVIETRRHFVVTAPDNMLYEVTEVTRVSDEVDASFLLVRDSGHIDFVMRNAWTFEDQTVTYRISDIKDRAFVQVSFKMPFNSKKRLETLAEGRSNRQLTQNPTILKLETNGGRWDGIDTDWAEHGQIRRLRHDLRQTIDFALLEAIERMRGTLLATSEAERFFLLLARFVVYDFGSDDSLQKGVKAVDADPDCSFDDGFGYPCSSKQKERLEKAIKAGTPLLHY